MTRKYLFSGKTHYYAELMIIKAKELYGNGCFSEFIDFTLFTNSLPPKKKMKCGMS